MKMPKPKPCEKSGEHVVKNPVPLDAAGDPELIQLGYRFRGTCSLCGSSIVAKDKKEYEI